MSCKYHFNWTTDTPCPYCRIEELEQQLAEVERLKEESSHLWVRIESGEAAAYEQGKAEARKQAAQEIADWLRDDIYSIESRYLQNSEYKAILFFVSNELRQRYGLEVE